MSPQHEAEVIERAKKAFSRRSTAVVQSVRFELADKRYDYLFHIILENDRRVLAVYTYDSVGVIKFSYDRHPLRYSRKLTRIYDLDRRKSECENG